MPEGFKGFNKSKSREERGIPHPMHFGAIGGAPAETTPIPEGTSEPERSPTPAGESRRERQNELRSAVAELQSLVHEKKFESAGEFRESPERSRVQNALVERVKEVRGLEAAERLSKMLEVNGLRTSPEFYMKSLELAEKSLHAEKHYFDELSSESKKKWSAGRWLKDKFVDTTKKLPAGLQLSKKVWEQSHKAEIAFMRDQLRERYDQRHAGKVGGLAAARREAVFKRYDNMYGRRIVQNATVEAKKAEQRVREEALPQREKNIIEKLGAWHSKLPPAVRIGTTYALVIGGATTTAMAGTLGAASLIPLALGGSAAFAAWRAATTKSADRKKIWAGVSRVTGFGAIAGLGARGLVNAYHKRKGTIAEADQKMRSHEGLSLLDMTDDATYNKFSQEWYGALSAEGKVRRQANLVGTGASLATGLFIGSALHEAFGVHHAAVAGHGAAIEGKSEPIHANHVTAAEVRSIASAPKLDHFDPIHADISGPHSHGMGAEKLFEQLQDKLAHSGHHSPLIDHLLKLKPKAFAEAIKILKTPHGMPVESGVMHPHESFVVTDHGELRLLSPGHPDQVLVHTDATGHLKFGHFDGKFAPVHHHVQHEHETVHQPEEPAQHPDTVEPLTQQQADAITTKANLWEAQHPGEPLPADLMPQVSNAHEAAASAAASATPEAPQAAPTMPGAPANPQLASDAATAGMTSHANAAPAAAAAPASASAPAPTASTGAVMKILSPNAAAAHTPETVAASPDHAASAATPAHPAETPPPAHQESPATEQTPATHTGGVSQEAILSSSTHAEAWTNAVGTHIDPTEPHVYTVGSGHHPIVWGGRSSGDDLFNEHLAKAQDFFDDPNNAGKIVLVGRDIGTPGHPDIETYRVSVDAAGNASVDGPFPADQDYIKSAFDPDNFTEP